MSETYYPLGHATAWDVMLAPVVIFACYGLANRRKDLFPASPKKVMEGE